MTSREALQKAIEALVEVTIFFNSLDDAWWFSDMILKCKLVTLQRGRPL